MEIEKGTGAPSPGRPPGADGAAARDDGSERLEDTFRRVAPRLRRTARSVLRDLHEAEDVAQDAMLAAWRSAGGLRDPTRMDAWLDRIARNLAITRLRKLRRLRVPRDFADSDGEPPWDAIPSPEPSAEAAHCVRTALDRAPPSWRRVFRERVERGRTFAEIADAEGVSVGCVKKRLSRLAVSLRDAL